MKSTSSCMACPHYDELRTDLLRGISPPASGQTRSATITSSADLPEERRPAQSFDTVMGLQSKDDIRALANYLVQAWDLRTAFLARMAEPT